MIILPVFFVSNWLKNEPINMKSLLDKIVSRITPNNSTLITIEK
jgi:hypothetical protein